MLMLVSACSNDPEPLSGGAGHGADNSEENGYGDVGSEESHDEHDGSVGGLTALDSAADDGLGDLLTDGGGNVLYLFTDDAPSESTCFGECAENWPPLRTSADADVPAETADGVSAELVGSIARDDGNPQVTFADWPLYTYAGDAAPGDVNGQGVGSAWYVLTPDGTMVTATTASTEPGYGDDEAGGTGYGDDDDGYGEGSYRQYPARTGN